jgi:hypothetical protein
MGFNLMLPVDAALQVQQLTVGVALSSLQAVSKVVAVTAADGEASQSGATATGCIKASSGRTSSAISNRSKVAAVSCLTSWQSS